MAGLSAQVAGVALAGGALILALAIAGLPGRPAGWAAACGAYLAAGTGVAVLMRRFYPHRRLGGCNAVTLIRLALVAALLPGLLAGAPAGWAVAAMAGVALALDGVDGWLARRSGLASDFGARFDVEVDAALALVLALHALAGTAVGAELLVLGLIRYVFVAAGALWPWLAAPLPQRLRRKAVCVAQLATLIALQPPLLPPDQAIWLTRLAVAALVWSFALDTVWLWRRR